MPTHRLTGPEYSSPQIVVKPFLCVDQPYRQGQVYHSRVYSYLNPFPRTLPQAMRSVILNVRISQWFEGKKSALSYRFDDSHPTHIEKAIPMLNEFGFVGTFLINPGNPRYAQFQEDWESIRCFTGGQERTQRRKHRLESVPSTSGICSRTRAKSSPFNRAAYEQFSAEGFTRRLDEPIEKGEWMESHFHGIDNTHL